LESKKSFSTLEREAGLAHSSIGSVVTFRYIIPEMKGKNLIYEKIRCCKHNKIKKDRCSQHLAAQTLIGRPMTVFIRLE
jgi:hypothetical protein